jgi:hypothetical protein
MENNGIFQRQKNPAEEEPHVCGKSSLLSSFVGMQAAGLPADAASA